MVHSERLERSWGALDRRWCGMGGLISLELASVAVAITLSISLSGRALLGTDVVRTNDLTSTTDDTLAHVIDATGGHVLITRSGHGTAGGDLAIGGFLCLIDLLSSHPTKHWDSAGGLHEGRWDLIVRWGSRHKCKRRKHKN
jgi:hypothetical protein